MSISNLEELCTCPIDTELQALVKVVNNFNKIFLAMASDYEGQVVSLIGRDGCGCTRAQIMAAFNANLIEFGRVYTGGGGSGSEVAMPTATADPGSAGEYALDGTKRADYVAGTGWLFIDGYQI